MRKKFSVLLYGSHLMGMGHLYRCRLIFEALIASGDFEITLAAKDFPESTEIIKMMKTDHLINLPAENEDDFLVSHLKAPQESFDYCIVDELNSSLEKMTALKQKAKRVLSFDDRGDGASLADVLINVLYPNTPPRANELNEL